jgi:hypothetical protein
MVGWRAGPPYDVSGFVCVTIYVIARESWPATTATAATRVVVVAALNTTVTRARTLLLHGIKIVLSEQTKT